MNLTAIRLTGLEASHTAIHIHLLGPSGEGHRITLPAHELTQLITYACTLGVITKRAVNQAVREWAETGGNAR